MSPTRPGLAKVRVIPLVGVRRLVLVGMAHPRVVELLGAADAMTEGGEVIGRGGQRVYFGSTSFVLALAPAERDDDQLVAALVGDVHLRALALRRARAEAAARASGPVGTARAELTVRRAGASIEIVIDLEIAIARAARAQR